MTHDQRMDILRQAIQLENVNGKGGITVVARKIGKSTTAVSLVLNGKYPGSPDNLLDAVEQIYATEKDRACPATSQDITAGQCAELRAQQQQRNTIGKRLRNNCPTCQHGG